MVAFSSASAAVRCAVSTQQLFERRYRGRSSSCTCGSAWARASRRSRTGTTSGCRRSRRRGCATRRRRTGSSSRRRCGCWPDGVDGARFESVGELELKGFPEPMEAFAVLVGAARSERPAPSRAVAVARAVARRRRGPHSWARGGAGAARARRASEARAGPGRWCCCRASRGSARPDWRRYAALGANADGFAVCWGACSEELAVPYEPWIEVCSQLVEHAPDELLRSCQASRRRARPLARNLGQRGCQTRRRRRPPIRRPSGSCCSRRSRSCCARWRRRCRCAWCSTTCTGPMASRWRCSSTWRERSKHGRCR